MPLWMSESPGPEDGAWEALAPEERLGAVAALARVMAKSISEPEEENDD